MLLLLGYIFAFGCQSISTGNYAEKENRVDYNIDAAGASYAVSLFPKTYGAVAGPSFSLVLVSPVLVSDTALYNSGSSSLIPWFNARGIAVWLVRIPPQMPLDRFGTEVLPQVTAAIRKNSTESDWVMGGISLGGQAIAYYLGDAPKHATVTGMLVKAAFFLGTPFDYEYPGSFGRRLAKENLSAENLAARFLPGMKTGLVAPRANLFAGGKPVWRDSLNSVSFAGKGVRTLFVAGKIDNVAPSESIYKFYVKTTGDETKNSREARFLQPGRMNRHARDYDHSMIIASDELASEILPDTLQWIDL